MLLEDINTDFVRGNHVTDGGSAGNAAGNVAGSTVPASSEKSTVRKVKVFTAQDVFGMTNGERTQISTAPSSASIPKKKNESVSNAAKLKTLFARTLHVSISDPVIYLGRYALYWTSCAFFCLVYWKVREMSQSSAIYRMWLVMWVCCSQNVFAVIVVIYLNSELKRAKREIRNGYGGGSRSTCSPLY